MLTKTQHREGPARVLISVIIPAYNYAHHLSRALESVVQQWAPDVEIIVVNDGSTDNTAEFLDEYILNHPKKIHVFHQANRGPSSARNTGVLNAEGSHVLMLDADDELLPGALDLFRKAIDDSPNADMVLGGYLAVDYNGKENQVLPRKVSGSAAQLVRRYLLTKSISICHGCTLFRRDALLDRLYPEQIRGSEDIPVFAYMLSRGSITVVGKPLVRTFRHRQSLRNVRENEEKQIDALVDETFRKLPDSCQGLRSRFRAQRYLSLFRATIINEDRKSAIGFYRKALQINAWQALQWNYLRRLLRFL